jgi:hypothetical protein
MWREFVIDPEKPMTASIDKERFDSEEDVSIGAFMDLRLVLNLI